MGGAVMSKAFTPEQRAKATGEILAQIAMGKSLRSICEAGDQWTPAESTFRMWVSESPEIAAQYACAREVRADVIFDEVLTIADAATAETVNVARLQIDARKWMAGKMKPKAYGDKLELGGTGPQGQIVFQTIYE